MEVGKKCAKTAKTVPKKKKPSVSTTVPEDTATIGTVPAPLLPGDFVALRLAKYDDEVPQVAKIISVTDLDVCVEWWIGKYHEAWTPWRSRDGVVTETMPRSAVIKTGIQLTKSNRMNRKLITELKHLYDNIEFI